MSAHAHVPAPFLAALAAILVVAAGCAREGRERTDEPLPGDAGPMPEADGGGGGGEGDASTVDGGPPAVCTAPEVSCGSDCADLSTDTQHCGACGAACPAWTGCAAPACEAPPFAVDVASYNGDWTQAIAAAPDGTLHVLYAYEESSGLSGLHVASGGAGEWEHRTLRDDFPSRMGFSDAMVDADGAVHVCYFHRRDETSVRSVYLRVTADSFEEEVVFEGDHYTSACALTRDGDGALHAAVLVRDPSSTGEGSTEVLHARRTGPGAWDRSTVFAGSGDVVGVDLVVAADGTVNIVFSRHLGHLDIELQWAVQDGGGGWMAERVDRGATIHDPEIVIHDGAPLVAYIRDQGIEGSIASQINLARRSAEDGSWSLERISDERLGFYVDLKLGPRGVPHLAYGERSGGDTYRPVLALLRASGVSRFVLEEAFHVRSSDVRLAFDGAGTPYVSYFAQYPGSQIEVLAPE